MSSSESSVLLGEVGSDDNLHYVTTGREMTPCGVSGMWILIGHIP
jgi:hypothetical protein